MEVDIIARRGLSLMEVVVTTSILAMVFMLVANLFPTSFMALRTSGQRMEAESLAASLLEDYRSRPYSQLPVGLDVSPQASGSYQARVRVVPVSGEDPTYLVELQVEVRWADKVGSHQTHLSSYVAALPQ
ncbi:MAG: prepilin-type N-terminal cleavage/methylation domain-containing protein [Vulcanimicrobiota bacterium]